MIENYIKDNEKLIAEIDDWIARSKPQYIEYEKCKNECYEIQCKYNRLLAQKEELFSATQPQALKFDKEVVSGGRNRNTFEEYLIKKDKIELDKRLAEMKTIVDDYNHLLNIKYEQLKKSSNIQDKIYMYRYVEKLKIYQIHHKANYSEAQIYRILKEIRANIKDDRK